MQNDLFDQKADSKNVHARSKEMDLKPLHSDVESEYREILQQSRKKCNGSPIGNLYPWHSNAAVDELSLYAYHEQLNAAKTTGTDVMVRILTGSGTHKVYGEKFHSNLSKFLDKGGKLRVIVWNKIDPQNPFSKLQDLFDDRVIVHELHMTADSKSPPHFLVVSTGAYRYEAPHGVFKALDFSRFFPEIPARISFGDTKSASELEKMFEALWSAVENRRV